MNLAAVPSVEGVVLGVLSSAFSSAITAAGAVMGTAAFLTFAVAY